MFGRRLGTTILFEAMLEFLRHGTTRCYSCERDLGYHPLEFSSGAMFEAFTALSGTQCVSFIMFHFHSLVVKKSYLLQSTVILLENAWNFLSASRDGLRGGRRVELRGARRLPSCQWLPAAWLDHKGSPPSHCCENVFVIPIIPTSTQHDDGSILVYMVELQGVKSCSRQQSRT